MAQQQVERKGKRLSRFRIITGSILMILSVVLTLSFISYLLRWKEDQSQAGAMADRTVESSNMFGKIGDWLGNLFIFESIGLAAFIIAFLTFVFGTLILKKNYFKPWKTISHSLFFIIWIPIFLGAVTGGRGVLSGVFGYQIQDYLRAYIGLVGLWLVIVAGISLYFILEFNLSPARMKARLHKMRNRADDTLQRLRPASAEDETQIDEEEAIDDEDNLQDEKPEPVKRPSPFDRKVTTAPAATDDFPEVSVSRSLEPIVTPSSAAVTDNVESKADEVALTIEKPDDESVDEADQKANDLVAKHGEYDHKLDLAEFQMPDVSLLKDYGNQEIKINQEELEENKNKIVGLLKNFNIGIAEIKATIGPTVTLYEIVPEAGIRVAQIKKLQDDIALNLSALGIRIIAPMPGKGTIGIEVPNQSPSMVSMRSVVATPKFMNSDMDLPVVFGKTISNEVFVADLAKMPHLLMAGATGQGKSVGINAILTSLLFKKHPSELKFVMVDPKKVELSLYSKIERHYLAKLPDTDDAIITDNTKVINTLNSLCIEMDNRYELLKQAFCKNIKEYNAKFRRRKLNPENGHYFMPYIVLVVDEFADLIMTAGKEVELPIARLAQLARAVGIHLIVATQRPSVNVITGMIKANFPARAAFRVIQSVDSRT
ncbi:MAG: DNA translocase FtsK, partial [Chryseobacterium sp.]